MMEHSPRTLHKVDGPLMQQNVRYGEYWLRFREYTSRTVEV